MSEQHAPNTALSENKVEDPMFLQRNLKGNLVVNTSCTGWVYYYRRAPSEKLRNRHSLGRHEKEMKKNRKNEVAEAARLSLLAKQGGE